jgi:hypothetical protein
VGQVLIEHALIVILVLVAALAFFGTAASCHLRRVRSTVEA